MKNQHQKVSSRGKTTNMMKSAVLVHSKKHEEKKAVDLLPPDKRKG